MDGWMDGWIDGTNGLVGWMDGWMDGVILIRCIDRCTVFFWRYPNLVAMIFDSFYSNLFLVPSWTHFFANFVPSWVPSWFQNETQNVKDFFQTVFFLPYPFFQWNLSNFHWMIMAFHDHETHLTAGRADEIRTFTNISFFTPEVLFRIILYWFLKLLGIPKPSKSFRETLLERFEFRSISESHFFYLLMTSTSPGMPPEGFQNSLPDSFWSIFAHLEPLEGRKAALGEILVAFLSLPTIFWCFVVELLVGFLKGCMLRVFKMFVAPVCFEYQSGCSNEYFPNIKG